MAFPYRRTITRASGDISGATSNVPVLVKFNSTDHPELFASGDNGDSVKFTSDEVGTNKLYHECLRFTTTVAEFIVSKDLSSSSDTPFYFWYGDSANSGEEAKTSVWGTSAKYIGHFVTDANDSSASANNGTVTGATLTADENYLGGQCYIFDNTTENIILSTNGVLGGLDNFTVIYQMYADTTSADNDALFCYATNNETYKILNRYNKTNQRMEFQWRIDGSTSYLLTTSNSACPLETKTFVASTYIKNTSMSIWANGTEATTATCPNATTETDRVFMIGGRHGTTPPVYEPFNGKIGFMWIFSEAKSDDWIKAVYNNLENYSSYITISDYIELNTPLYWKIVIEQPGAVELDLTDLDIIEYSRFTDEKGKRSDYFEISLYNDGGTYSGTFEVGNEVFFYVDSNDPPTTKIFHGLITSIDFNLSQYKSNRIILSGEDYGSIRLGQTIISGSEKYSKKTADEIVSDLLDRYCPEITTTNLEVFEEEIPSLTFSWEYVGQAIDKVAQLVGADYYVDENDDLNFYDYSDLSADHTITSQHIISGRIKKDSAKYFDRVYVVGGKQGFLDTSQATTTTEVAINAKQYASTFVPSKSNLLYFEVYVKKVGSPLDNLNFTIIEDNSGTPSGTIVGFGSIPKEDTSTDGGWVKTTIVDAQLDLSKTNWLVFNMIGTATDTYKLAHDNTTASGHKYKESEGAWTADTGKLAFKTYYGVQIVKGASGTKIFDYHTDLPIIDFTIQEADTALTLAEQKVIEYALKNSSRLVINPPVKRIKAGQVVEFSTIAGVPTLEDQTILAVTYEINERQIPKVILNCTAAEDFYSTFSNLFAELRRLKVKNVLESQDQTTDYKEVTETTSITLTETITEAATDYDAQYDDGKSKWDVSKWT